MSEKPSAEYWEARCNEWMGECDRIRQQRDEAWASVAELENIDALEAKIAPIIAKAEARGYERGVKEAAALAKDFGLPVSDELNAVMTYRQKNIAAAILALLEPTLQKPEA
jgi:hypothetical protein